MTDEPGDEYGDEWGIELDEDEVMLLVVCVTTSGVHLTPTLRLATQPLSHQAELIRQIVGALHRAADKLDSRANIVATLEGVGE